jgi:Ca-activated chloride channel family protein
MLKGLDAIAEVNPAVQPVGDVYELDTPTSGATPRSPTPRPDEYAPDVIVLLTDGRNTRGIEPLDAVQHAVERRVRVYTIGFGTTQPSERSCTRQQLGGQVFGGQGFGGGFGGGFAGYLVADAPTLKAVAERTGGSYHAAEDADQLRRVFSDLPKEVATQRQQTEVTWMLAALGALLAATAVSASIRWSPFP